MMLRMKLETGGVAGIVAELSFKSTSRNIILIRQTNHYSGNRIQEAPEYVFHCISGRQTFYLSPGNDSRIYLEERITR